MAGPLSTEILADIDEIEACLLDQVPDAAERLAGVFAWQREVAILDSRTWKLPPHFSAQSAQSHVSKQVGVWQAAARAHNTPFETRSAKLAAGISAECASFSGLLEANVQATLSSVVPHLYGQFVGAVLHESAQERAPPPASSEGEVRRLRQALEDLHLRLAAAEDADQSGLDSQKVAASLHDLERENAKLALANDLLRRRLREHEQQDRQAQALAQQVRDLQADVQAKDAQLLDVEAECTRLCNSCDGLEASCAALDKDNAALRAQLQQLSWQVAAESEDVEVAARAPPTPHSPASTPLVAHALHQQRSAPTAPHAARDPARRNPPAGARASRSLSRTPSRADAGAGTPPLSPHEGACRSDQPLVPESAPSSPHFPGSPGKRSAGAMEQQDRAVFTSPMKRRATCTDAPLSPTQRFDLHPLAHPAPREEVSLSLPAVHSQATSCTSCVAHVAVGPDTPRPSGGGSAAARLGGAQGLPSRGVSASKRCMQDCGVQSELHAEAPTGGEPAASAAAPAAAAAGRAAEQTPPASLPLHVVSTAQQTDADVDRYGDAAGHTPSAYSLAEGVPQSPASTELAAQAIESGALPTATACTHCLRSRG